MSSFQICMASSAGLPLADSPPVRAMPKPILIGFCALAVNTPAPASTTVTVTAVITAQVNGRLQSWLIASSLSARGLARRALAAGLKLRRAGRACQGLGPRGLLWGPPE